MAQDPFRQLAVIRNASRKGKRIHDCYRLMYKEALWIQAFLNITGTVPDDEDRKQITRLITRLRDESFRFGNMHENEQSPFFPQEHLVGEVIRMILVAVFEPVLRQVQPEQNFQRILLKIKSEFSGVTWCMQGIVKDWSPESIRFRFNELFARKIADRRFLLLLDGLLKTNFPSKWDGFRHNKKERSCKLYSLLMNLYFHKFDCFFHRLQTGSRDGIRDHFSQEPEEKMLSIIEGKKLVYVRHKQQFLIGLEGRKQEARLLQEFLELWLSQHLFLASGQLAFAISHLEKPVLFFGYAIRQSRLAQRSGNKIIRLEIPRDNIKDFARKKGYGLLDRFHAKERGRLVHQSEREILAVYNRELLAFTRYYCLADNFHAIKPLYYLAKKSMLKTIAQKRSTSVKTVLEKLMVERNHTLYLRHGDHHGRPELYPFISLKALKKMQKNFSFNIDTYG